MSELGRVVAVWRYPVKSMAGEALTEASAGWHGLAGDRRWAFVRDGAGRSGFPWLTIRERPDLWQHRPALVEPERPDASDVLVTTPGGAVHDVADPALGAALGGRALKCDRGVFDTFPVSLITTATIDAIGARVGAVLDRRRFRPNLLIEADAPFAEDRWVGATLQIGTARVRIDKRDGRCVVVTVDPDTQARDPRILRVVAQEREGCLGVYGSVAAPGRIGVGDAVTVA